MGLVSLCVIAGMSMRSVPVGRPAQLHRITYMSDMLRDIGHRTGTRPRLPNPFFKLLQDNNIARIKPRGNRDGTANKCCSRPIETCLVTRSANENVNKSQAVLLRASSIVEL